jgi:hypothetical protein
MADLGNTLRALSQVYKAGIFATHHHGKLLGGDPGDDLRGSSALAAAGDVNLGLYREQAGYLIRGEGRDIGEFSLPITFDLQSSWCWQLRDDKRQILRDKADNDVLDALSALGEVDAAQVAEFLGKSPRTTADRLRRLAGDGTIRSRAENTDERGRPRILFSIASQGFTSTEE